MVVSYLFFPWFMLQRYEMFQNKTIECLNTEHVAISVRFVPLIVESFVSDSGSNYATLKDQPKSYIANKKRYGK